MDLIIKEQWIAALRSGRYDQGTGYLHRKPNQFCCLGVLCDLLRGDVQWTTTFESEAYVLGDNETVKYYPPDAMLEEAALSSNEAKRLAQLNDDGCTFDEIADDIKQNL